MTISKAVELLIKFQNMNPDIKVETATDIKKMNSEFQKYLHSKRKNQHEVNFKLDIAISKGFIVINPEASTMENFVEVSENFSDYIISQESTKKKFVYGLIGSAVTVGGGLIGALIAALL